MLFQSLSVNQSYEEFINRLINNCYLRPLPTEVNAKTLYNRTIILNSCEPFEKQCEMAGYFAIVFIHEMGHVFARDSLTTALDSLEFDSEKDHITNDPKSLSFRLKKSFQTKESGYKIGCELFGKELVKLNELGAEFLGNANNWNSSKFRSDFKKLNSKAKDAQGNPLMYVRMRKISSNSGFIDLSHNWCGTTRLKH